MLGEVRNTNFEIGHGSLIPAPGCVPGRLVAKNDIEFSRGAEEVMS